MNKNFENVKEYVDDVVKRNFVIEVKETDQFAYTDFDTRKIVINENLEVEARIFMLLHEYSHILEGDNQKGRTHFSIQFENADKSAFDMFKNIKDLNINSLKRYSFIFNKIEQLY